MLNEVKPDFKKGYIYIKFYNTFLAESFHRIHDEVNQMVSEFYGADVKIISQIADNTIDNDIENKIQSNENKLNQENSSESQIQDQNVDEIKVDRELYPIEKILIEKLKAKDITNKI